MKTTDIEALLPEVYRRAAVPGSPMAALLEVMARSFDPIEATLDRFPDNLRADQADPEFVMYLASFMDLDRFFVQSMVDDQAAKTPEFSAGVARLRDLIHHAPRLSRLRGTREGLCQFLEVATGRSGFVVDDEVADARGRPRPFHIRVTAPDTALWFRDLVTRIVAAEKPAYTTSEILFESPENGAA